MEFRFTILSRRRDGATEYQLVACVPEANPLYGYGSWDVAASLTETTFREANAVFQKWLLQN